MSSRKRVALTAATLALGIVLVGGVWLYRALRTVPQFYADALNVPVAELENANREMLRRSAALSNDLKRTGKWEAVFSDQQLNGWLAVDVPKNHPDLIPAELREPRVSIRPGAIHGGARFEGQVSAVVSIEVEAKLANPNELAVRIKRARVGDVPWALDRVIEQATAAAQAWGVEVSQTQSDGDPVLLLKLPANFGGSNRQVLLERMELRDGELHLAGQTSPVRAKEP